MSPGGWPPGHHPTAPLGMCGSGSAHAVGVDTKLAARAIAAAIVPRSHGVLRLVMIMFASKRFGFFQSLKLQDVGRRCGRARWAGTLTIRRRRVEPLATPWASPARIPAARSRLWAITARWTSTKSQGEASVEPRCAPDGFHKVTYLFYQVN